MVKGFWQLPIRHQALLVLANTSMLHAQPTRNDVHNSNKGIPICIGQNSRMVFSWDDSDFDFFRWRAPHQLTGIWGISGPYAGPSGKPQQLAG
jgi:hypothetical protein